MNIFKLLLTVTLSGLITACGGGGGGGSMPASKAASSVAPASTVASVAASSLAASSSSSSSRISSSASSSVASGPETYVWKKVSIGGGGYVTGVVFSEAQSGLIYSRTDVGGAYRWDVNTRQWIQLLDWIGYGQGSLANVESIAADPKDPNRVYIVGGENDITRLMRSTDRGNTFELIDPGFKVSGNGPGRGKSERLVIDPNSTNILFYGTRSQGLYKSTDRGSSWTRVTSFPVAATADGVGITGILMDKRSSSAGTPTKTLYVTVSQNGNSLFKSTDAGNTWQSVAGSPGTLTPIDSGMDSNGMIYISYGDGAGPNGVGIGSVWKFDTSSNLWFSITPPTGQGGFGGIGVDTLKPGTIMVATVNRWWPQDEVYRSVNGGISWVRVDDYASRTSPDAPYMTVASALKPGNWIFNLRIDPFNSNNVMHVTGAGIWSTTNVTQMDNGQTTNWTFLVKGIEEGGSYEMISPPSGAPLLSVFGDIQGFRHTSLTQSPAEGFFQLPGWGTGNGLDFAQNDPNKLVRTYIDGSNGAYSLDNGVSWNAFASKPAISGNNGDSIALSANGNIAVWSIDIWNQNTPPFYSTNNGQTWTQSNVPGLNASWYSLRSDRVNNSKFYLYNSASGYLHVSTDGGANFVQKGYVQKWGYRIATNPWKEGEIWVPVYDGLYYSTDSGTTFTHLNNVQQAASVSIGKAAPNSSYATIYLQGKINDTWGFYRSTDHGATWVRINDDKHQYAYSGFIVADQRVYGRVFFSTHCMGIAYGEIQ